MSLIQQYAEMEAQLKHLQEEMRKLKDKGGMEQELEFKRELDEVMEKYGKGPTETIEILSPYSMAYKGKNVGVTPSSYNGGRVRRPRKTKVYRNPHDGSVCESRGGNSKTLREWKEQYPDEDIENWIVREISADGVETNYETEDEHA